MVALKTLCVQCLDVSGVDDEAVLAHWKKNYLTVGRGGTFSQSNIQL